MKRLVNATIHSLRGLRYTITNETAVRQEAMTLGLAILLGFFISPGPAWYVANTRWTRGLLVKLALLIGHSGHSIAGDEELSDA